MTPEELASNILAKHEDDKEYHFYDVDREWIIEAMIEFADETSRLKDENIRFALKIMEERRHEVAGLGAPISLLKNILENNIFCKCEKTTQKIERDCHPYGDNIMYDECDLCGKKHNFKCF